MHETQRNSAMTNEISFCDTSFWLDIIIYLSGEVLYELGGPELLPGPVVPLLPPLLLLPPPEFPLPPQLPARLRQLLLYTRLLLPYSIQLTPQQTVLLAQSNRLLTHKQPMNEWIIDYPYAYLKNKIKIKSFPDIYTTFDLT